MLARDPGYTLIELLVALAILVLLFSFAIPGIAPAIQRHRGEALIQDLARIMNYARAAAVDTGQMVTVCHSDNGNSCGGQWLDGILVFSDANADRTINQFDQILRYSTFGSNAGSLSFRSFPNRQFVQFSPLGFTNKQNGSFTWCPHNGSSALAQQLIFSQSGRSRLARDQDGDGIREGSNGKALICTD